MKVLVCGGRDYSDKAALEGALDAFHNATPITALIEGGARGADHLACDWARANKIPRLRFDADWATHGNKAGPLRNIKMLEEGKPDVVMAFPGGRGTFHMRSIAQKAGVRVIEPIVTPS